VIVIPALRQQFEDRLSALLSPAASKNRGAAVCVLWRRLARGCASPSTTLSRTEHAEALVDELPGAKTLRLLDQNQNQIYSQNTAVFIM
jgi:hypothetical protein